MTLKKSIIWIVVCTILILSIGGGVLFLYKNASKRGMLKIDGVDITKENVMIYSDYAELPLTEVMKSLDMKVDWVDESTAAVIYKEKKYTLNLSNVSLVEAGQNFNLLLPPPGGNRLYTVIDKELILDSNTIKSTMYQLGIKINIDINRKEQIVYILTKTEDGSPVL